MSSTLNDTFYDDVRVTLELAEWHISEWEGKLPGQIIEMAVGHLNVALGKDDLEDAHTLLHTLTERIAESNELLLDKKYEPYEYLDEERV